MHQACALDIVYTRKMMADFRTVKGTCSHTRMEWGCGFKLATSPGREEQQQVYKPAATVESSVPPLQSE
ncbi:hypothetical protein GJAV_G00057460 [Gymnothorax javanicus]|nr:hypothetical protein GJAV_G00057460 [Gymnothorax javanicus]